MKTKTKQNRLQLSRYAIYLVLVGMVLFFSIVAEGFFSASTFLNILRQVAVNGIVAVGMTMVIITGGIDISVGSVAALAGVCGALVARISKEVFRWTDTYVIEVANPLDALCVLMLVLAIDAEKCSRN